MDHSQDTSRPDETQAAKITLQQDSLRRRMSASSQSADSADEPLLIGGFQIIELVGSGACGVVYRGRSKKLKRDVAIKVPRPEFLADADHTRRFETEAQITASLDHPSIVPVYEANLSHQPPFIVSAFCPGPDLRTWLIERNGPVAPEVAARLICQLSEAVEYAHQNDVFHRDIKPGNILLQPVKESDFSNLDSFRPRITDFGIAKSISDPSLLNSQSSMIVGTPMFMAPEVVIGIGSTKNPAAADVYSIGVILYQLLTLRLPFEAETLVGLVDKIRSGKSDLFPKSGAAIPESMQNICKKCLSLHPEFRYPSAADLAKDLRRFLEGDLVVVNKPSVIRKIGWWSSRPDRIVQAGWFTVLSQLFTIGWMLFQLLASLGSELSLNLAGTSIIKIFFLAMLIQLPQAWMGWKTTQGSKWAFYGSIVSTVIALAAVISNPSDPLVVHSSNHLGFDSRAGIFASLVLGYSLEILLYVAAIPALRTLIASQKDGSTD